MITHNDLFAGIGGFALALEEVFDEAIRHIFCEWESFPTSVLRQHWPDSEFWGDIVELVTHTDRPRPQGTDSRGETGLTGAGEHFTIVTGGFPCQPFSAAGRRKGTADDRYQWPNMLEVIRHTKPEWVIAENVRGLVTWNEGMVLEQVCADMESEGYEVQPFIIPAVAVNAPHRRDRVWILAHSEHNGQLGPERQQEAQGVEQQPGWAQEPTSIIQPAGSDTGRQIPRQYPDWSRSWQEVALATCDDSVDDGLSRLVDGVPYSRAKWRKDSLKAYGNSIVPQVAIEIIKAIKTASGKLGAEQR